MSSDNKKIIYGNGEHYIEPFKKGSGWGEPTYVRSYDEARDLLVNQIKETEEAIATLGKDDYLEEAIVFCLRLDENFIAKSYHPEKLIEESPFEFIGSQKWKINKLSESKLLFVRGHEKSFPQFLQLFNRASKDLTKEWINDVRKIQSISLLQSEEKLLGFEKWQEGKVELVVHPLSSHADKALAKTLTKLKKIGADTSTVRNAQYERGLTFVSVEMSKQLSKELGSFNLLRSAHPLGEVKFPTIKRTKRATAPQPPANVMPSSIKVGIFDGGTDPLNPLLLNHVTEFSLTKEAPDQDGRSHGSAVAGCVLYGPLNGYQSQAVLPAPSVSVDSFRVFPTSNPDDPELYEIIDSIETVVSQRTDIRVFNLSFGPPGPIVDNHIRRFTYALDRLAHKYNVLFTVAVGNAGEWGDIAGRVQSPADGINILGVGAHTYEANKKTGLIKTIAAPYSCYGPGREGCKVKPDISAYGGCDAHPIALVSDIHGHIAHASGTSFSSPIVAGNAAELLGRCPQLNPLQTRVLLINRSQREDNEPHPQLGHGISLERVDEILECANNRVTVLYNGTLTTKKYAKIPIPFIKGNLRGKLNIRWTIGVLTKPDIENVDEYSTVCIEDTFYPHSEKFKYVKLDPKSKKVLASKTLDLLSHKAEAAKLIAAGWQKHKYPISKTGSGFKTPEKGRRGNLKWDTVVDRQVPMMANGLYDPFLIVHAMSRNEYLDDFSEVSYGVAVTIEYPGYKGDLYTEIGSLYAKLSPVSVRPLNQIVLRT